MLQYYIALRPSGKYAGNGNASHMNSCIAFNVGKIPAARHPYKPFRGADFRHPVEDREANNYYVILRRPAENLAAVSR